MTIAILEMASAPKSANKFNASFCAENLKLFQTSEFNGTSAVDELKEFSMTNVQQMNLIGYYYHGHVWGRSSPIPQPKWNLHFFTVKSFFWLWKLVWLGKWLWKIKFTKIFEMAVELVGTAL